MSYPFSILPFLISLVFLLALTSEMTSVGNQRFSMIRIFFLFTLVAVTGVLVYKKMPMYQAYKGWQKTKILLNIGFHQEAITEYDNLYPFLQHETEFLFEYAHSLSKSEQYEKSNLILEKAMAISCDPMLYNIKGKNYQAMKLYELAEQSFIKASLIVPSRLYPYYLLSKLYEETGRYEKVCEMADFIHSKEAKVHSEAVNEIREKVKSMCEKYNPNKYD